MPTPKTIEITEREFDNLVARTERAEKEAATLRAQLNAGKSATEILAGHREADRVAALESEVSDLRARLETETRALGEARSEVSTLRAQGLNASTKAAELLAAKGIAPMVKASPRELAGDNDLLALWEQYQRANATEKTRLREQHGDKLTQAAEAYDRATAGV